MKYKNEKVRSVRLSGALADRVDGMAEELGIPVSSLLRSFIISCVHSLPRDVDYWVKQEGGKKVSRQPSVPSDTNYDLDEGGREIDSWGSDKANEDVIETEGHVGRLDNTVESETYKNGLPRKDNEGNIISEDEWRWAIRNYRISECPCRKRNRKRFMACHGRGRDSISLIF